MFIYLANPDTSVSLGHFFHIRSITDWDLSTSAFSGHVVGFCGSLTGEADGCGYSDIVALEGIIMVTAGDGLIRRDFPNVPAFFK